MSNKRGREEIEYYYSSVKRRKEIEERTDSFTSIINSLSCINNNKYLEYETDKIVYQFPKNKIYVRDFYITTYNRIWNFIHENLGKSPPPKVILLGQPGIGKTSFMYYLLFMLKYVISPDENKDEGEGEGESESDMQSIISCMNVISMHKKRIEILKKKEKIIDIKSTKIEIFNKKSNNINDVTNIIRNEIEKLKSIIQQYNEKCEDENLKIKEEVEYPPPDWFVKHKVNRILEEGKKNNNNFENLTKIASNYYSQLINLEKNNKSNTKIKNAKSEINKCADEIYNKVINLNNEIYKQRSYENYKKYFENNNNQNDLEIEKSNISVELGIIMNNLELKEKELEEIKNVIKNKNINQYKNSLTIINDKENKELTNEVITKLTEEYYNKNYNFLSLNKIIKNVLGNKSLYVVKAVNGNNTRRVYKFSEGKLYLSSIDTFKIKNSIVITDTFGNINESNIVISISSPDSKNFQNYNEVKNHKTIYFDTFSDEEMKEWYLNCIDNHIPPDFSDVCEMYGNVTRQVYFHYVYENNYHKNYWEYYKNLINSVVGSIGFDEFISTYIPQNKLKNHPLSNIIMKYDLYYNKDGELKPKDSLIFVSSKIGMYVCSMLFPPKKIDEYIKILQYYAFNNNDNTKNNNSSIHDECIEKMLLKQIAGYKIALGEITIESSEDVLVNRNSSSFSYFPFNAIEEIIYILDEDDIFDFVLNGIFIKILHKDTVNDDYGVNNKDMKELNKLLADDKRLKEIKEKYIISNNKINYLTINEDEIIGSKINKIVRSNTPLDQSNYDKYSKIKESNFYNEIKEKVKNNPNKFLEVLEKIKIDSTDKYKFVLNNLEEFALLLKEENDFYYYNTLDSYTVVNIELLNEDNMYKVSKNTENGNRFNIDESLYIYRKCYEEMIYIIERNLINEINQKNYLIFGNKGIGKTILAEYLNFYFINKYNKNFNILFINRYDETDSYYYCEKGKTDSYCIKELTPTPPYIVISDEIVVGEDEYSDASMVIVIGNSSDKNIKTFQSKRFPLIMYIPPFTESEINSLTIEDYEKELVKKYGGIIGYYYKDEDVLKENIAEEIENNKKFVKEMLNGENKSQLSKGYSSIIFIYNTFENDVTKSTKIQFISDEVKEITKKYYYDIYLNNNYSEMLETIKKQPNGELGGIIFEKLILYLCDKSEDFKDLLFQNYDFKHNFTLKLIVIKNDDNLKKEIENINNYLKQKIIPIFDLSYNSCFPDVDILLSFIGVQITVGLTHSLSADIIDMLNNLKEATREKMMKEYNNDNKSLPDYLNDLFNSDLKFMVISNNRKVNLKYREVKEENKFPQVLWNYRNETKTEEEKKEEISILNSQKDLIYISLDELTNMVNKIINNN